MSTTTEPLHAARLSLDTDTDPSVIVTAAKQTIHDGNFAARLTDSLACGGVIVTGAPGCIIEGQPAARVTDSISHGSVVMTGTSLVVIGNVGGGAVRNGVAINTGPSNLNQTTTTESSIQRLASFPKSSPSSEFDTVAPLPSQIFPLVSGGQRDFDSWSWRDTPEDQIANLRTELLQQNDLGRVQRSLQKFGLNVSRQHLLEVKKYNFDSPGLVFSKINYDAWNRLAWGVGTVADAQYLVHELKEIAELRQNQQETGFDFLGKNFDKLPIHEQDKWKSDFIQFYLAAHRKALEAEYDFLANQVQMLTNNRLTISRVVTAVNDPSRSEALREMMVDGVPLKEHPNLHLWTKKGDEFADIGTSAREKLDLPLKQKVTISHVIGMVKLFKTGS